MSHCSKCEKDVPGSAWLDDALSQLGGSPQGYMRTTQKSQVLETARRAS